MVAINDIVNTIKFVASINNKILQASPDTKMAEGIVTPTSILKQYLTSFTRQLTAKFTAEQRLAVVKKASYYSDQRQEESLSKFFLNFGSELTIVALGDNDISVKEELFAMEDGIEVISGETIKLIRGKNEEKKLYTSSKAPEGVFTISRDEHGKTYAMSTVKTIVKQRIQDSIISGNVVLKIRDTEKNVIFSKNGEIIKQSNFVDTKSLGIWQDQNAKWKFVPYHAGKPARIETSMGDFKMEVLLGTPDGKIYELFLANKNIELDYIQPYKNHANPSKEDIYLFGRVIG